ncbi:MAG: ECF transporter S component [Halanaerobiales bacterium]
MERMALKKREFKTREITVIGLLFAVTIVLGVTGLGFIPIPPFKSTIMHIPVIIGAILEGPVVGALTGLLFGLFSMLEAVKTPSPVSFIFLNPVVAVFPRVLIGINAYLAYRFLSKKIKKDNIAIAAAIATGSFTNTIGVVGLIYLIYVEAYAEAMNISVSVATTTLLALIAKGFLTATIAIIFSLPVILAVKKFYNN